MTAQPTEQVRKLVRSMLEDAPSYRAMAAPERQKMARGLVDVMAYLADPAASLDKSGPAASALAAGGELRDANQELKKRLASKPEQVGKDFKAGAAREGGDVWKSTVASVDFPKFVSSLINGVYDSIVKSSIKQMQAYAQMLATVTKSVDQFAKETISEKEARDFVAQQYPGKIGVHPQSGQLVALDSGDDGDGSPPDFKAGLQMADNVELNEENEKQIVLAAQIKMARQRQQTLAQMVMMGINRIIVTDGEIKASVLFDMKSHDDGKRRNNAGTSDTTTDRRTEGGGWFSDPDVVQTSVSSAYSNEQDQSSSTLDMKAKLSGSVTVKFKSETFPLERLASADELGAVQGKSAR